MGLARRGSRRIVVDNVDYRWVVSPDSGFMVIVIELVDGKGTRLEVQVSYNDSADGQSRITPAVVRRAIECARADGWNPEEAGNRPFQMIDADERLWK